MLKQWKPFILCFYVLAAALLAVGTFVDLKLDVALNNPTSEFARWFEATGEMPSRLVTTVAGVMLFYLSEKPLLRIFGLVANFGGAAYLGEHLHRYFFRDTFSLPAGIVFGLGVGVIALYIGQYIHVPEKLKKPLIILCVAGIAVWFTQMCVIESVKIVWGRVRYRELLRQGSMDGFMPWYRPGGFTSSNEFKSFPSGHTAGAGLSFLMMLLPYVSPKWKQHKVWCFILPLAYTGTVAFSRMMMGAHFLSDVTVGATVTFTAVVIAVKIIDKKFSLHFEE